MSDHLEHNVQVVDGALSDLLPEGVIHAVVPISDRFIGDVPKSLIPSAAVPKRQREFASGRVAASMALRGLGRPDHFPEVGSMRQPIWPPGVTGSISHDAGVASAAVAHTSVLPGLGIDIERAGTLEGNVAAQILSESELDSWTRAAQADAEVTTMLVFSYKEAIFKCVYPLTDVFLDFRDVLIEPPGSAPTARCVDPANPCAKLVARTTGRVGRFGEQIVAVCWLEKKG